MNKPTQLLIVSVTLIIMVGLYTGLNVIRANVALRDFTTSIATETATAIQESQQMTATELAVTFPNLEDIREQELILMQTAGGPDEYADFVMTSTALTMTYAGTPVPTPTLSASRVPMTNCAWSWATQYLHEYDNLLRAGLDLMGLGNELLSVSASAFGENCLNQDLGVTGFGAIQTDYTINLRYYELPQDEAELLDLFGDTASDVFRVLAIPIFSPSRTPGPQIGEITIRFILDDENGNEITRYQLIVNWDDAMTTLEDDLQGGEIIETLGGLQ